MAASFSKRLVSRVFSELSRSDGNAARHVALLVEVEQVGPHRDVGAVGRDLVAQLVEVLPAPAVPGSGACCRKSALNFSSSAGDFLATIGLR